MGQQHRKIVKRRRRTSYLERKKATAKAAGAGTKEVPAPRAKKAPTAARSPAA